MDSKTNRLEAFYASLSPEQIQELNEKMFNENERQAEKFKEYYQRGECYLCKKSFKTISRENPCLHWLLRQCKFKPKDLPLIYNKFSYTNIAAFLRWAANQERLVSNINDLSSERADRKVISNTIKWKNIEWTFDCANSDFSGHKNTSIDFPHYHFQMRIDGKQFINFNTFHLPFSDVDIDMISLSQENNEMFHYGFGYMGVGMEDAMSLDPDTALEFMSPAADEEATYHLSTIVQASDKSRPISGDLINEAIKEAQLTNKSISLVLKEKLAAHATITTIIAPSESIPDIAARTEHKSR
ncbi:hypothetical protein ACMU59_001308 [Yersinia enterocolitica]